MAPYERPPTYQMLRVIAAFFSKGDHTSYGQEVMEITSLTSPTVYHIMAHLKEGEIIKLERTELGDDVKHHTRHYYKLTKKGVDYAEEWCTKPILQSPPPVPFSQFGK